MGVVQNAALLRTLDNASNREAELLTALLAEQQQTNHLLAQLIHMLSRQALPSTTSWGRS
jgi:hypothetical protein